MAKNEPAAVQRAVKEFGKLDAKDRVIVLSRLTGEGPTIDLARMARIEEIHNELGTDSRTYLRGQLIKLDASMSQPAPPAEAGEPVEN